MKYFSFLLFFILSAGPGLLSGQEIIRNHPQGGYLFTIEKQYSATPVKNQARTGTCWSFSTVSFFESELIRMGKGEYDLSEMYVVRNIYDQKARLYARMHGKSNFGPGGTFHDVINTLRSKGMVPEDVYNGRPDGQPHHNHNEMDEMLAGIMNSVVTEDQEKLPANWQKVFAATLDIYLGAPPETFEYKGKSWTPQSFAASLELNPDDYIEITSFTHHPWYEKFILEIPDNWDWHSMYNLPLDEMMEVVEYALDNGFTIGWDTDVTEATFSHRNGVAIIPDDSETSLSGQGRFPVFDEPGQEKTITSEIRQQAFDDYSTTDDHLMHIAGTARDQNGTKYYMVKNSWGEASNQCGGYLFASDAYLRMKTIHILVHKDGIPKTIRKKLGL